VSTPKLPLAGLRVLDLTQVLAGPYCTMILGDLGADVVKVERPGDGDGSRRWGPPFVGGESAYFMQVNRNKRSIAVDLRADEGREVVRRMVERADVVLHNFLPEAAVRYGADAASVHAVNPLAVHCTITGYPTDGEQASSRPGWETPIRRSCPTRRSTPVTASSTWPWARTITSDDSAEPRAATTWPTTPATAPTPGGWNIAPSWCPSCRCCSPPAP